MLNFEIEVQRSSAALIQKPGTGPAQGTLDWLKVQARFGVPVWAVCLNCEHTRLLDAADLLVMVKPDVTELAALSNRMRCRCCDGKACELRAATPVPEYCS